MKKNQKGLTLVELLIVIAVIAILAAVSFVAIDPASRFAEARNAQRWSDVSTIMEGVQQAFVDDEGDMSSGKKLASVNKVSTTVQVITSGTADCSSLTCSGQSLGVDAACADLSGLTGEYFSEVPVDPSTGKTSDSQYYVDYNSGIFTIGSCDPEAEKDGSTPTIRVSR